MEASISKELTEVNQTDEQVLVPNPLSANVFFSAARSLWLVPRASPLLYIRRIDFRHGDQGRVSQHPAL
jgi:hypothetical protein